MSGDANSGNTNVLTGSEGSTSAGAAGAAGSTESKTTTGAGAAGTENVQQTDAAKVEAEKVAAAKTAEDKKAAEAKATQEWDSWKPKLPDGVQLDEKSLGEFKPLVKELGLDAAKAQKLVDFYTKVDLARAQEFQAIREGWVKELRADKEFGGERFDDNVKFARQAINAAEKKFPGTKEWLDKNQLFNAPALAKVFAFLGKDIAEDSIGGSGDGARTPLNDDAAFHAALYPSMQARKE